MILIEKFKEMVNKYPEKIAIKAGQNELTFEDLHKQTDSVARRMVETGEAEIQKSGEQTAALLFEHGVHMIVGVVAALKSGKIYIPFDPSYPERRLSYMLENSGAGLLVTNWKNMPLARRLVESVDTPMEILNIEVETPSLKGVRGLPDVASEDKAYILYTSGSTGKPKGVIQSQQNIWHFIKCYRDNLSITAEDRLTLFSAFSHDAAVMDIYTGLLTGATLYPLNIKEENITELSEWLNVEKITVWHSVPTLYRYFVNTLTGEESFPNLRYLVMGGEAVVPDDVHRFQKHFPFSSFVNLYGQSESSYNSSQIIAADKPFDKVLLGDAVEDVEILVLNDEGEEVDVFEEGEIVVVNDHAALGYWKDRDKTAEVFADIPEVGRIYRTGDLGRVDFDGSIEFAGRKDFQIKIRGYRVELGEIESVLLKHDTVAESVVIAAEEADGNKYLCAYVVAEAGRELQVPDLREYMGRELMEHMIPSYFVQLEAMPVTPTGKIDRKQLPAVEGHMLTGAEYAPPTDAIEEKLVDLWQKLLNLERVGIDDNFFEMGGHSLKATVLAARIHKEMQVELPLREIFGAPTIKGMARYIRGAEKSIHAAIGKVAEKEDYRLSSAQKRLFALARMEPESTGYNMPEAVEVEGPLDREKLERVFMKLMNRHESLRTSFFMKEEEPVQVIHGMADLDFSIKFHDVTSRATSSGASDETPATNHAIRQEAEKIVQHFTRPFDLSQAPLLRVELIKQGRGKHILLLDMHHIISDGTSKGIIINEAGALYGGKELQPLRLQYKDYAAWQQEQFSGGVMAEQRAYWLSQFSGDIPTLEMPTDYPRPAVQRFEGDVFRFTFNSDLTSRLKEAAGKANATLYMTLLSLFTLTLARYSNQEDIVVGTGTAGRPHADLQDIVGMFINTLCMRSFPAGSKSVMSYLAEVREMTLKAFENQDYQFEELVEALELRRDLSRNPLFDAMFVLQNMDSPDVGAGDLIFRQRERESKQAKFDLTLTAGEMGGGLAFFLEYATSLFRSDSIHRFAGHMANIARQITAAPLKRICEIDILSDDEKMELLVEFNNSASKEPSNKTLHQLFGEQAERTPEGMALLMSGTAETDNADDVGKNKKATLTYSQLDRISDHLAQKLIQKGVVSNTIVGVLTDRSLEMITALLGILKAGGAYLPIDPSFPASRIRLMVKDSGVELLLTGPLAMDPFEKMPPAALRGRLRGERQGEAPPGPPIALRAVGLDRSEGIGIGLHSLSVSGDLVEKVLLETVDFSDELHVVKQDDSSPSVTPDDAAYVIYTSGTTGTPKGTLISHNNVVRVVKHTNYIDITPEDALLQLSNYAFDGSTFDIYGALLNGAKLVLIPKDVVPDAGRLTGVIKNEKITVFFVTTALFNTLVELDLDALKGLRKILFGGERISVPHAAKALAALGPGRILHVYGPTESTVFATYFPIDEVDRRLATIPIGYPLTDTEIFILDKTNRLQPIGVAGELCIAGKGLSRGYLNRPELTMEKFVPFTPPTKIPHLKSETNNGSVSTKHQTSHKAAHIGGQGARHAGGVKASPLPAGRPLGEPPEASVESPLPSPSLLYRTGDLARWLGNGAIEFLGRLDHQVKLRGFRIELGEIEARLNTHESIKEAIVMDRADRNGNIYLCAYMVPAATVEPEWGAIKDYLAEDLPEYMIPAHFVIMEKLPLSSTGKVNRHALPEPEGPGLSAIQYEAPRDETEKCLVAIWQELLKAEPIGIHDNFFNLGGHSLKATILCARVHKELEVELPLREVFQHPTISGLASFIRERESLEFHALQPVEKAAFYRLSSAQKRLYTLYRLDGGSGAAYNMPVILEVEGALDKNGLEKAFLRLLERHESLRTAFEIRQEEPVQVIHDMDQLDFSLQHHELSEVEGKGKEAVVDTFIDAFIRPFDLSRAPLFRAAIIEATPTSHILMVDMHHIVSDGTSMGILVNDLAAFYEERDLPPLRVQYKDYADWQKNLYSKGIMARQENHWLNLFAGELPVLELPYDFPRPAVQRFEGSNYHFSFDALLTRQVKDLAAETGTTLYMVLTAIYTAFLGRYCGQEDIVVGTPIAGRPHADLQGIIGMFVNTLALRNFPSGDKSFSTYLDEVKERTLSAFENQDFPFEELVEKLEIRRDLSRNPLFDTMFALINLETETESPTGLIFKPYGFENPIAKFDLTLNAVERGETISFNFQYCVHLFGEETVACFARHFTAIAGSLAGQRGNLLAHAEMLSEEEKRRLLIDFNNRELDYRNDMTIQGLFARQVERVPGEVAVVDGSGVLTYGELNEKAGVVARKIRTILPGGSEKNELIGILMERSEEMIVGLLGILKAGCGYVPLNPKAPVQRNCFILEECRVKLLLTQEHLKEPFTKQIPQTTNGSVITEPQHSPKAALDGGPGGASPLPAGRPLGEPPEASEHNYEILTLDAPAEREIETLSPEHWEAVDPGKTAYVIFTSGSTGKPKGVPITHANFSPFLHWGYSELGISVGDRALQNLSYYFDWSVWEIFITLTSGAALHMVAAETLMDPGASLRYMRENEITVLHVTPTQYQYLLGAGAQPETLKFLFIGAENFSRDLLNRTLTALDEVKAECRVFNMYGPTEATIVASVLEVKRESYEKNYGSLSSVPIGGPIANTELYVLDAHFNPCPLKVAGELYIAGEGVASGYLNNPGLTAGAFLPLSRISLEGASFSLQPSPSIYKTGDRARWLPDGTIEFLGRIDHQVKIRGFRIELGEIENQLAKHEGIKETVVLDRESPGAGDEKCLCAYIVVEAETSGENTAPDASELKTFLSHSLPDYMIPSYFIRMDFIPLNANGKTDRRALPEPEVEETSFAAPTNDLERTLVSIWADVLGLEKELIGLDSDFFGMGGHSLKATVMTARVHKAFDVEVPLTCVFKTPTVRGLAEYIGETATSRYREIERVAPADFYPVSSAQKRLFALGRFDEGEAGTGYNMPAVLIVTGSLDAERVENCFLQLIERHESLRTSFHLEGEQPVQVIHTPSEISFSLTQDDLKKPFTKPIPQTTNGSVSTKHQTSHKAAHIGGQGARHAGGVKASPLPAGRPPGGPPEASERAIIREFIRPFDLSAAPLFRAGLVRLGGEKHLLMVDMHHIISDGASMGVLTKEFSRLYNGEELPPLRLQYKDYAAWHLNLIRSGVMKKQEEFWKKEFSGDLPVLELPYDYARPAVQGFAGSTISTQLNRDVAEGIKKLAREQGATAFMTLLAVYSILMGKYTSKEDVIVGSVIAGRPHADLESIIGMFVNTLAFRNYPARGKTVSAFLSEVKERSLQAFENQDFQFDDLVDRLNLNRDISRNPLFDTMFVQQNLDISGGEGEEEGLAVEPYPFELEVSKFDLTLTAAETGDSMALAWEYSTKLFKESTIQRMGEHFNNLAAGIVADRGSLISEVDIMSAEERRQVLVEFNDTAQPYPAEQTLHGLFEEQAALAPELPALLDRMGWTGNEGCGMAAEKTGLDITYGQLNSRAQTLAVELRQKGLKPGSIVALMMERSVEMIVAILGILKAGGAYLPIEPTFPADRIRLMLEDTAAPFLITDQEPDRELAFNGETLIHGPEKESDGKKGDRQDIEIEIGARQEMDLERAAGPTDLAYLIYTSGSTGRPKGVMVEHGNIVAQLVELKRSYQIGPSDRFVLLASYIFDASLEHIFLPLISGGPLLLPNEKITGDARLFRDLVEAEGINVIDGAPAFMAGMVEQPDIWKGVPLRFLMVGGDVFSPHLLKRLQESLSVDTIINMYGPTETTVNASWYECRRELETATVPIGPPMGNYRAYILDENDKPQPIGIPGRLYVGGVGVTRGYLNNPELTDTVFLPDSFNKICKQTAGEYPPSTAAHPKPCNMGVQGPATREGITPPPGTRRVGAPGGPPEASKEKMYFTGDLARWLPDGTMEFLGRIDNQVNIRGFRVEPGEIENSLLSGPGVMDAVVAIRQDQSGDNYLCAYVVSETELTLSGLRDHLAEQLPKYMIPAYFVQMEKLPLTATGKVDKKALPEPMGTMLTESEYVAPTNTEENLLVDAMQTVLNYKPIGIHDSFFDLGGDSIKAIRLLTILQTDFEVALNDIFRHPTAARLSRHVAYKKDIMKEKIEILKSRFAGLAEEVEEAEDGLGARPELAQDEKSAAQTAQFEADAQRYRERLQNDYLPLDLSARKPYKHILLTGATGYLGVHLLVELLKSTTAEIDLVVRGKNGEDAKRRLAEKVFYYFEPAIAHELLHGEKGKRIHVFAGDLSAEGLGLAQSDYAQLSQRVDCIINSAAYVRHYGRYEEFQRMNVDAVANLIDFALAGKKKDLNHVSTTNVASGQIPGRDMAFFSEFECDLGQEIGNLYSKSKLESEKLVLAAREKGLKTNIIRVGNLVFHSATGRFQENIGDNAFYLMLRASAKLGAVPGVEEGIFDFCFIDYAARSIVLLFDREALSDEIYHIHNENYVSLVELAQLITAQGLEIKTLDMLAYLDHLFGQYNQKEFQPFVEDILLHTRMLETAEAAPGTFYEVAAGKTDLVLEKLGFTWPHLNAAHVEKMVAHWREVKFV